MKIFTGNKGSGQQGFTLIELLVVIGILAVLAAVAIPAYSRFFGEGNVEANLSELSNIQASMDAMMAHHRLLNVYPPTDYTDTFDNVPIGMYITPLGVESNTLLLDPDGAGPLPGDYEYLHPAFLRIGAGGTSPSPTKCEYTWDRTGFVKQYLGPGGECHS